MSLDDGNFDGSPFMSMLGIQNALRTGNIFTDMVLAMCIPFVLKIMFLWVEKLGHVLDIEYILKWFERERLVHERFISYTSEKNVWGGRSNLDEDTHNELLLKAIQIYLHQVVKVDMMAAFLDLMVINDDDTLDNNGREYDEYGNVVNQKTLTEQLSHYKILNRLPFNEWHDIGHYGKAKGLVQLRIEYTEAKEGDEKNGNQNAKKIESTTFHFTSDEKDAIDDFVNTAYTWYLGVLRKMEDNARYYYEMKLPEMKFGKDKSDNDTSSTIAYKRYKLSEEKTFESLFFREKDNLLALIDHFAAKTGKYGIKGYPHKLGLLLHGPPGTGKTSLIKALAQYTGRSIVNVPLSRVTTNSELMSVFFDRKYQVEDSTVPVKLDFKDVIYVMEDCDAASKIVKKRSGESPAEVGTTDSVVLPNPKSLWRLLLENTDAVCQEVVEKLLEVSERLKEEAEKERPKVLCSIAKRLNDQPALGLMDEASDDPIIFRACTDAMDSADVIKKNQTRLDEILTSHAEAIKMLLERGAEITDDFVNELLGETRSLRCHVSPSKPNTFGRIGSSSFPTKTLADLSFDNFGEISPKGKSSGPSWFKFNPDALSLSGLLNVLDGVVDTPGRIVILTSNHPELLDPALIRPGRVDKTLKLGYMEAPDIVNMLELYYQTTLSNSDVARVVAAVDGCDGDVKSKLRMTPAQIEQLTAEHDQLEDMIRLLEEKSPSVPTKTVLRAL